MNFLIWRKINRCQEYYISTIKNEFLPQSIEKYTRKNAKITSLYSEYNTNIPKQLHERPHAFIRHVTSRNFAAHEYVLNHIHIEDENVGIFAVKIQFKSGAQQWYKVDFSKPSCKCVDWSQTRFPCKHFMFLYLKI